MKALRLLKKRSELASFTVLRAGGADPPHEIAMTETAQQPCERRPEALLARPVEIEARLE